MWTRHTKLQIMRTFQSVFRKRVLQAEAIRASSNRPEKPPDLIPIYTEDFPNETKRPDEYAPVYTQGYEATKRLEPYSRELSQHLSGQINVHGTLQNRTEFSQNQAGFQPSQFSCLEHCCCGCCSGGKKPTGPTSDTPPCYPQPPCCPPTTNNPCCPNQPCYPCWCRHPCCCTRCGPCSTQGNWCIPQMDCCGNRIVPPPECRPGPVPPNPCCPQYPKKGVYQFYKKIFLFVCIPIIILQFLNVLSHEPCPKIPCRDFEYMRIRSKRFPWGDGVASFFHNEEVNHLPGDCEPPPMVCEE